MLENDLREPGRWLADHPLIGKLERGDLTRGQIAGLMGQVYRQTVEVVRWLGMLYAKCPDMGVRREIFNNLLEEELGGFSNTEAHFHLAARTAVAAGAKRDELDAVPLTPQTQRMIDFGEKIFYHDDNWLKPLGLGFGFEYQSPAAYGPIAEALKKSYGMTSDDVAFFEVHVTADEDHADSIVRTYDKFVRSDEERALVPEHSNLYAEHYYDMLSSYQEFD